MALENPDLPGSAEELVSLEAFRAAVAAEKERSFVGKLFVCVKSASNLRNADGGLLSGKSEPYVKVTLRVDNEEAQSKKTKTINNNLNPV